MGSNTQLTRRQVVQSLPVVVVGSTVFTDKAAGENAPTEQKRVEVPNFTAPAKDQDWITYGNRNQLIIERNNDSSTIDISGGYTQFEPLVDGNTIYIATAQKIFSVNFDGNMNWSYTADGGITSIHQDKNYIYIVSGEHISTDGGEIISLDKSGDLRWKHEMQGDVRAPGTLNNDLVAADVDGNLISLTTNGELRWTASLGTNLETQPLTLDKTTCVVGRNGIAVGYNRETGSRRWQTEVMDSFRSLTTATARHLITPHEGGVSALDPVDGKISWEINTESRVTAVSSKEDLVVGATKNGKIIQINDMTGEKLKTESVPSGYIPGEFIAHGIAGRPVIHSGVIYLAANIGEIIKQEGAK